MTNSPKNLWLGYAFIVAGLFLIGMTAVSVWNWNRARSWTSTVADVVSIDLNTRTGSGPRSRSTSSTLSAIYEYKWEDHVIRANGISPFDSIECSGDYKRKVAERLRTAKAKRETVTCYVNADSPREAYLNREFRWMPVLMVASVGMLFFGVGCVLVRQQWRRAR